MDSAQTSSSNSDNSDNGDEITGLEPKVRDKGNASEQTATLQSYDQSHNQQIPTTGPTNIREEKVDLFRYWPLRRAIHKNDWKAVDDFVSENPEVLTATISEYSQTIFNVLPETPTPIWLLEKFVSMVPPEFLEQARDVNGYTALCSAAILSDAKASEILVRRSKNLPYMRSSAALLPVHLAARYGREKTVQYLLSVTDVPLDGIDGFMLLKNLINSNLYGIAYDLLQKYPKLARDRKEPREIILTLLARKPMAFASGSC